MAALAQSGQREPHGLQFSLPSSTMDCRIIHCRVTVVDSDLKKMKSFIIIIIDSSSSPRFKANHLHSGQVISAPSVFTNMPWLGHVSGDS